MTIQTASDSFDFIGEEAVEDDQNGLSSNHGDDVLPDVPEFNGDDVLEVELESISDQNPNQAFNADEVDENDPPVIESVFGETNQLSGNNGDDVLTPNQGMPFPGDDILEHGGNMANMDSPSDTFELIDIVEGHPSDLSDGIWPGLSSNGDDVLQPDTSGLYIDQNDEEPGTIVPTDTGFFFEV